MNAPLFKLIMIILAALMINRSVELHAFEQSDQEEDPTAASQPLAKIPFQVEKDRIVLSATIKNSRKLSLILDTGYPHNAVNLLSPELGRELDLTYVDRGISGGAGSGSGVSVRIARPEPVRLGDVEVQIKRIVVMNERRPSFPAQDGIIAAWAFLEKYVVEIDFDNKTIKLHDPRIFRPGEGWSMLPLDLDGGFPIITATVDLETANGIPVRLVVDLGGRGYLVLTPNRRKKIMPPANAADDSVAGASGKSHGKIGRASKLTLGDLTLADCEVFFSKDMHVSELGADGILGIFAIQKFNLVLDYKKDKIYFKPNSSY